MMLEPHTKLPPISENTVLLCPVFHQVRTASTMDAARSELSTPQALSVLSQHISTGGCLLSWVVLLLVISSLPWHRRLELLLSELKEGVILPNLLQKFFFILVGIGQCLFSFYKFLL